MPHFVKSFLDVDEDSASVEIAIEAGADCLYEPEDLIFGLMVLPEATLVDVHDVVEVDEFQ